MAKVWLFVALFALSSSAEAREGETGIVLSAKPGVSYGLIDQGSVGVAAGLEVAYRLPFAEIGLELSYGGLSSSPTLSGPYTVTQVSNLMFFGAMFDFFSDEGIYLGGGAGYGIVSSTVNSNMPSFTSPVLPSTSAFGIQVNAGYDYRVGPTALSFGLEGKFYLIFTPTVTDSVAGLLNIKYRI